MPRSILARLSGDVIRIQHPLTGDIWVVDRNTGRVKEVIMRSSGDDMTPREHRVRERAYKLWNEAGQPKGRDEEFWYEAQVQIDAEDNIRRSTTGA